MDSSLTSQQLVRLLAEPARRKIVAALTLAGESMTASDLAEGTGLDLRTVVDAADRLETGGLVAQDEGDYELIEDAFKQAARSEAPAAAPSEHSDKPIEVAKVLDVAFRDGRLVQWPAKRAKRLIVLDHLAQQFEIGKRYQEAEVNVRLRVFDDDVAMMRRYLVDEQFLDRSHGEYWRCGGSF